MIYFIQCGNNGPVKIGFTERCPINRCDELQTGCPYELKLVWQYYGRDYSEQSLHDIFSHERVRGEWFHPTILDEVYSMCGNVTRVELYNLMRELVITEKNNGWMMETRHFDIFVNYTKKGPSVDILTNKANPPLEFCFPNIGGKNENWVPNIRTG